MTNPIPTDASRVHQEAAQIALALRDLGYLTAKPTAEQLSQARAVFESRHGYPPANSEEQTELIAQRLGQMMALALLDEPMQSFGPPSPNSTAGKLIKEAKSKERLQQTGSDE